MANNFLFPAGSDGDTDQIVIRGIFKCLNDLSFSWCAGINGIESVCACNDRDLCNGSVIGSNATVDVDSDPAALAFEPVGYLE